MSIHSSSRREFLAAASAAAVAPWLQRALKTNWPIGCHTRPFTGFRASQAGNPDYVLDAVKAAGFEFADMISAGTPGARGTPPVPPTAEAIAQLKQKLAARGLKSNIANLPTAPKGVPVADAIAST